MTTEFIDTADHVLLEILGHRPVKSGPRFVGWEFLANWNDLPDATWSTSEEFSASGARKILSTYKSRVHENWQKPSARFRS